VVHFDLGTYIWICLILVLFYALLGLLISASHAVSLVIIGTVFALALNPLVLAAERRFKVHRVPAVAIVGAGLFLTATIVVLVLGPPAVRETAEFRRDLPKTIEQFYSWPVIGDSLKEADASKEVVSWLDSLPQRLDDETVRNMVSPRLLNLGRTVVPSRYREQADTVGRVFYATLGRYFGGSVTVAGMMGLYVLAVGLLLGVPLVPLAAVWAMLTDLIPQVGGFLGGAVFVVLALSAGAITGFLALVLFVAYMNFENHVIQPLIVGKAVDLTPPTSMVAVLIGGAVGGVPGAMLATPVVGAGKVLWRETSGAKEATKADR
jgi:predicted PurR-regulated permease PerM